MELGVSYWREELGIGRRSEWLADGMERRLVESVGWMLDLFVAGRWIPFLLCRQYRRAQEMRVIIDEGGEGGRKDGRDTGQC